MEKKVSFLMIVSWTAVAVLLPTIAAAICPSGCSCDVACSSSEISIGRQDCPDGGNYGVPRTCCCPCGESGTTCTDSANCCQGLTCESIGLASVCCESGAERISGEVCACNAECSSGICVDGKCREGMCTGGCTCAISCSGDLSENEYYACAPHSGEKCCCPEGGSIIWPPTANSITLNLSYPTFGGLNPSSQQALNQVIGWFYYFVVGISGFFAFFGMVMGGFSWMSSAGSPSRISDAKDQILAAVLGLIIILASFLILQIINPELTTLRLPSL